MKQSNYIGISSNRCSTTVCRGPAGADGKQGPIGPAGKTGATGQKGDTGPSGGQTLLIFMGFLSHFKSSRV